MCAGGSMRISEINAAHLLSDQCLKILMDDSYWPESIKDILTLTCNKVQAETDKNLTLRRDMHAHTRAVMAETFNKQGGHNLNWPTPETWERCQTALEQATKPDFKATGLAGDKRPRAWAKRVSSFIRCLNDSMRSLSLEENEKTVISEALFSTLSFMPNGSTIYIPKTTYLYRSVTDMIIYNDFNGNNKLEVCLKHSISAASVSKAVKRHVKERRIIQKNPTSH